MVFIIQILDEIEKLLNSGEDYFIIKSKLAELWSKLYLKEKRENIRNQLMENYDLIERITELEQQPFYFIEQQPLLLKPNTINLNDYKNQKLTEEEIKLFLETMIYDVRMNLKGGRSEQNFLNAPLTSYCMFAKDYLLRNYYSYFDGLNICGINIPYLLPSVFGHYIVIVNFESFDGYKTYLLDPTYRQFCLLSLCNKNRIYHYDLSTAPGYFVKDEKVIKTLLKDGYLEINEHNCKIYCDSFVLAKNSFDNKKIILESGISGEEYVKSLMRLEPIKK